MFQLMESRSFSSLLANFSALFKKCLEEGYVPEVWKEANVVPLYKKGSKKEPLNYRPVSLTSCICKLMEGLIRDHMMNYFEDNNILMILLKKYVDDIDLASKLINKGI